MKLLQLITSLVCAALWGWWLINQYRTIQKLEDLTELQRQHIQKLRGLDE